MKFSDLTYREFLAMEIYPEVIVRHGIEHAPRLAFNAADTFLEYAGIKRNELTQAIERATKAEQALEVMRDFTFVDEKGNTIVERVALTQLWEMLGARNQTEAVATLKQWKKLP